MSLTDRIHDAARPYIDGSWRYPASAAVARRVAYPWPQGVRGPSVATHPDDRRIDCSTLTASILMRAFHDAKWDAASYASLQVFHASHPDSPVTVCPRMGIGVVTASPAPEEWALCQGWRRLPSHPNGPSGHAVLVYDRGNGVLDLLESTSRENFKGPRWRMTTWTALQAEYPAALYVARLDGP